MTVLIAVFANILPENCVLMELTKKRVKKRKETPVGPVHETLPDNRNCTRL